MYVPDAYDGGPGVAVPHAGSGRAHRTPAGRRYTSRRPGGHHRVTDSDGRIVWEAGE